MVSRSRQNEQSSPAQQSRQRETTSLPPYQAPSCPLTAKAKRELDNLRVNQDTSKYKKHIAAAIKVLTDAAFVSNDRLSSRKAEVAKLADKRRNQGIDESEKSKEDIEAEQYADNLEKKVTAITSKAEKALRELIDYGDELSMQDTILKEVVDNIPSPPANPISFGRPRRSRGEKHGEEDEEGEVDVEAPSTDPEILSALELLQKAKEAYAINYASKSMRQRYLIFRDTWLKLIRTSRYDVNDYRNFKRGVHDACHQGENAPPVPHASTWFDDDTSSSSRRVRNSTDNTNNADEDSDEEVIIQSETRNLKCPLTLQYFIEPYSNNKCKHTFEKAAILDYHQKNAVAFMPSTQRGQRTGPRQIKCPQTGCEKVSFLSHSTVIT